MTTNTHYVMQSHSQDIPIGSLYLERWRYDDSPPFQRDKVWPEKMKRSLVDSVLRGFYIPALLAYPRFDAERGQKYEIVDGQQRLHAIFEFMDGKFKTGKADNADEPYYTPLEPNKSFSQLSMELQEQFRAYPLRLLILDDVSDNLLGVMFRRLQNQIALTTAEKLWSYMSEATRRAADIAKHPFFQEMYIGRTVRKEPFQSGLYALMLELSGGFCNTDQQHLKRLAAGKRDDEITSIRLQRITTRLDKICHLFQGTRSRALLEMVIYYQTVMFLELAGYDLPQSEAGCLTPWIERIQKEQIEEQRTKGYMSFFYLVAQVNKQKHFWINELPALLNVEGLYTSNKQYTLKQIDRIIAWIKQSGVCLECNQSLRVVDIDRHIVRHADKYDTSLTTCLTPHQQEPMLATASSSKR